MRKWAGNKFTKPMQYELLTGFPTIKLEHEFCHLSFENELCIVMYILFIQTENNLIALGSQ